MGKLDYIPKATLQMNVFGIRGMVAVIVVLVDP